MVLTSATLTTDSEFSYIRERLGLQPRELHTSVCAACGAQTTVPFLPRYQRPVYCSACFERVRVAAQA